MRTSRKIISCAFILPSVCICMAAALPDAKLTIKVVNEENVALTNMPVHVWLSDKAVRDGETDSNGLFIADGPCSIKDIPISIVKQGYYASWFTYEFPNYLSVKDDKWQPWNPVVTMVVWRVVNPIAMYAKHVETKIPSTNQCFGFDLEMGDWVVPLGRGTVSDLVFRIRGYYSNYRDNDSLLTMGFSNPDDGIWVCPKSERRKSLYEAPLEGYSPSHEWRKSRQRGTNDAPEEVIDTGNEKGILVFRVRSKRDSRGQIADSRYGKLLSVVKYGGAASNGCYLTFTYCLNPMSNNRNLEFDPKRNLLKNLKSTEEVSFP